MKDVYNFYIENYKTMLIETKEELNKWRDVPWKKKTKQTKPKTNIISMKVVTFFVHYYILRT